MIRALVIWTVSVFTLLYGLGTIATAAVPNREIQCRKGPPGTCGDCKDAVKYTYHED